MGVGKGFGVEGDSEASGRISSGVDVDGGSEDGENLELEGRVGDSGDGEKVDSGVGVDKGSDTLEGVGEKVGSTVGISEVNSGDVETELDRCKARFKPNPTATAPINKPPKTKPPTMGKFSS